MSPTEPESAAVVGARARARVAAATPRRPVAVLVVAPSIRAEQTPATPHTPQQYTPVSLVTAPWVTWEESIRGPREELLAGMRRALAASVAGVAPCEDDVACYSGRDVATVDADDYLPGRE